VSNNKEIVQTRNLLFHRYKLYKFSKSSEDSDNYANIQLLCGMV